jgi:hypothetical protein
MTIMTETTRTVTTKKESLKCLQEVTTLVVGEVQTAVVMGLAMCTEHTRGIR